MLSQLQCRRSIYSSRASAKVERKRWDRSCRCSLVSRSLVAQYRHTLPRRSLWCPGHPSRAQATSRSTPQRAHFLGLPASLCLPRRIDVRIHGLLSNVVTAITRMVRERVSPCLGPTDPDVGCRIKKPCMDLAVGNGHPCLLAYISMDSSFLIGFPCHDLSRCGGVLKLRDVPIQHAHCRGLPIQDSRG